LPAEFQAQESLAHQRSSRGGDCAETAMGKQLETSFLSKKIDTPSVMKTHSFITNGVYRSYN